ncbi:hypothetical protein E2320_013729 [Naja naja]|nr:hypothetical protein E2320_013729 [Naja naja]
MSQATKRKHVVKEVLEEYVVPSERQQIVRVLGTPGNNLHEVETPEGTRFLVSMPTKFRKNIWIKRAAYPSLPPSLQEISYWLTPLKKGKNREGVQSTPRSSGEEDSEDDDTDLFVNTNRITYDFMESDESSESEEEEK